MMRGMYILIMHSLLLMDTAPPEPLTAADGDISADGPSNKKKMCYWSSLPHRMSTGGDSTPIVVN